jgi:hypothetical protein
VGGVVLIVKGSGLIRCRLGVASPSPEAVFTQLTGQIVRRRHRGDRGDGVGVVAVAPL